MRRSLIGVMGSGDNATQKATDMAFELGKLIAQKGWVTLSGGRSVGVMDAVSKGAKSANGLTIGLLPISDNSKTSEHVDVAILTGMGSARNNIEILSCDALVVVAESMGSGTASEIALALKVKKRVILLSPDVTTQEFFTKLGKDLVFPVKTPKEAIAAVEQNLL